MVSTNQISNLASDLSTATGIPKVVCEQIIQKGISEPTFVIPLNVTGLPLYTTGSTTGSTPIPAASSSQTVINASSSGVSTPTTMYTVPANKVFYCYGWSAGSNNAGAAQIQISAVMKVAVRTAANNTAVVSGGGCPLFKATAGDALSFVHSYGATSGDYTLWGIEMDA